MTYATLNAQPVDMTQDDADKLSGILDRYCVMDVMDAIAAKYRVDARDPRKKLKPPCWHIELTVWDKAEFRLSYGPFAGAVPNLKED